MDIKVLVRNKNCQNDKMIFLKLNDLADSAIRAHAGPGISRSSGNIYT